MLTILVTVAALLTGVHGLKGELFYATCDLPACDTLALATLNLQTGGSATLFDFPFGEFEDSYVADSLIVNGTAILSLQYDGNPSQGYLLSFDVASKKIVSGFNASFCFNIWLDPNNADTILCLALEPACDGGSQCTQLRHISRSKHTDKLVSSFLPNFAPYTVSTFDPTQGLVYSTFTPLNGGSGNVLLAVNATSGAVKHSVPFPFQRAFIQLEYDLHTGKIYAVVQDQTLGQTYLGVVNPTTATASPVGPAAVFNTTEWNQFNTISTLSPELGVMFFTAFHYNNPGPPPSDPILHLLGNNLSTGAIVFDQIVRNPFCEILWLE